MPAARTQKKASANTRKASPKRGTATRSVSRTRSAAARSSATRTPRSRSASARGAKRSPARSTSRTRGLDPRITAAALIASIVIAAWTVYPVLRLQYQQERERQTLEAELEGLKDRNAELRQQVEDLKTPEGVERLARETLGLARPGEAVYVVTGGMSAETSVTAYGPAPDERPLGQRVLDAIFGFQ